MLVSPGLRFTAAPTADVTTSDRAQAGDRPAARLIATDCQILNTCCPERASMVLPNASWNAYVVTA